MTDGHRSFVRPERHDALLTAIFDIILAGNVISRRRRELIGEWWSLDKALVETRRSPGAYETSLHFSHPQELELPKWNKSLEYQFLLALHALQESGKEITPASILRLMDVEGISDEIIMQRMHMAHLLRADDATDAAAATKAASATKRDNVEDDEFEEEVIDAGIVVGRPTSAASGTTSQSTQQSTIRSMFRDILRSPLPASAGASALRAAVTAKTDKSSGRVEHSVSADSSSSNSSSGSAESKQQATKRSLLSSTAQLSSMPALLAATSGSATTSANLAAETAKVDRSAVGMVALASTAAPLLVPTRAQHKRERSTRSDERRNAGNAVTSTRLFADASVALPVVVDARDGRSDENDNDTASATVLTRVKSESTRSSSTPSVKRARVVDATASPVAAVGKNDSTGTTTVRATSAGSALAAVTDEFGMPRKNTVDEVVVHAPALDEASKASLSATTSFTSGKLTLPAPARRQVIVPGTPRNVSPRAHDTLALAALSSRDLDILIDSDAAPAPPHASRSVDSAPHSQSDSDRAMKLVSSDSDRANAVARDDVIPPPPQQ